MPNLDPAESPAADATAVPGAQPTVVPAEHNLSDLYTGGRRRLNDLTKAVGRPLARWAGRGRSAAASAHGDGGTGHDAAQK